MVWGSNDGAVERWIKQLEENDPALTSLHILSIRRVSQDEFKKLFGAVAHNTTLRELYCSGHSLTPDTMEQLSEALTLNDTLERLNVGTPDLGQSKELLAILGEGLAVNEGLRHLDMENKGLDDASLAILTPSLAKNASLRSLNLARNNLTDGAVLGLNGLGHLEILNLSENKIGASGAQQLSFNKLHELDLSYNPLMEGAGDLMASLAENAHLISLKLVGVTTEDRPDTDDANDVKTARSEHGNHLARQTSLALKTNRALQCLWMDENGIETVAVKDMCQGGLIELRMRNNKIGDEGAVWLAQGMQHLERLDLGGNLVGYEGFGALLGSPVRHLSLFNNKVNGLPDSLPCLQSSGVETLDVGCNNITVKDLEGIVQVLLRNDVPRLRLLEMGGNAKEEDVESWEAAIARLQAERGDLEVAWKRFMEEQQ
ncbi:hypothetical protein BX666DRAFT_1925444 [Dichotomocladium elegans]|nr:hypothetical protein BX666DRAFT_1925444 [Dichotomocladium elegans]